MAKFRNVSGDDRLVGFGLPRRRLVQVDELLSVPDELIENYDQPDIWELVEGERPAAPVPETATSVEPAPVVTPAEETPAPASAPSEVTEKK